MQTNWWQRYAPTPSPNSGVATLKRLIWLYLLLWLFEGALRKWIFPSFSAELLLVRDPLALWIILYAMVRDIWRPNLWIVVLWIIGAMSFFVTLGLGIYMPVAVVGLRTLCLHFPLIFIIGQVLTRADVEQLGNITIDLSLPMGLLMAVQFASPADSFINVGAGIDSLQLDAVDGRIRAPGVFSFIAGAAQYYSLVAAFLLPRIVARGKESLWLLTAATVGAVLAICMAVSRTLTVGVGLVGLVFVVGCLRTGIPLSKLLPAFMIVLIIGLVLSFSTTVREGLDAFVFRWTFAEEGEGSILTRAFKGFTVDKDTITSAGVLGNGLGVGTNMGSKLMTGDVGFLLAEEEWPRIVMEMGAPLGLAFVAWRVALAFSLVAKCVQALIRKDLLPVVIFASAAPTILNGQTGVPATLGFLVIAAGLTLAAAGSHRVFVVQQGLLVQQHLPRHHRHRQLVRHRA
jgi:hypothetical protein